MKKYLEKIFETEEIQKDEKGFFIPICVEDLTPQKINCGIFDYCEANCIYYRKVYLNENK
jgi:hypothetical protein